MARLIVISNRLPVTCKRDENGEWEMSLSSGGLVAALSGLKQKESFLWVGWPGMFLQGEDRKQVEDKLRKEHSCIPVWIEDKLADEHYNGFSNGILWPLFHYMECSSFDKRLWNSYTEANKIFADTIEGIAKENDCFWVHDYHLMILPRLLRERLPTVRIGFFLHIPFPSSEIYRILSVRDSILSGLLNCNLVGFHTYEYARHFLNACTRILGADASPNSVTFQGRETTVGVFPVGIEPQKFSKKLTEKEVKDRINDLRETFKGKKVIIGVDRLDYIKGVPYKFKGFREFLRTFKDFSGQVVLLQVAVPSRTDVGEYQKLKSEVDQLVGSINSEFGSVGFSPVHYLYKSVDITELCALYSIADACLITSIRDGMNLVSMEYVVCQQENHGVLILSEFAGASGCLGGVVRVNPWNTKDTAAAIYQALSMPSENRKERHDVLMKFILKHTSMYWGESFVEELHHVTSTQFKGC